MLRKRVFREPEAKKILLPGEESRVPGEGNRVPGEESRVPVEGFRVPSEGNRRNSCYKWRASYTISQGNLVSSEKNPSPRDGKQEFPSWKEGKRKVVGLNDGILLETKESWKILALEARESGLILIPL